MLSFLAWLPLWLVIKIVGFVLLIALGPLAETMSRDELRRRAPVFTSVIIPIGRTLLFAGIVLLVITKWWRPLASPRFSIVMIAGGLLIFVLERVALATVWALGKGRNPRT